MLYRAFSNVSLNISINLGTRRLLNLTENPGSASVKLTTEDAAKLAKMLAEMPAAGPRYGAGIGGKLIEKL
jgi:hypothetical protein